MQINEAYEVLKDPAKRAEYDAGFSRRREEAEQKPAPDQPKRQERQSGAAGAGAIFFLHSGQAAGGGVIRFFRRPTEAGFPWPTLSGGESAVSKVYQLQTLTAARRRPSAAGCSAACCTPGRGLLVVTVELTYRDEPQGKGCRHQKGGA
jgi:curved DNA-binding protein CbpA